MGKYFIALLLTLCILTVCSAQRPRIKNYVKDFKSACWNTAGARWNEVRTLMDTHGLDVFAIQEAGTITPIAAQLSDPPAGSSLQVCYAGFDLDCSDTKNLGLEEKIWNTGTGVLYVYYYNNRLETPLATGTSLGSSKPSMAIISKTRVEELVILPNEVKPKHTPIDVSKPLDKRCRINRPIIGVRIGKSVFFNIHTEPAKSNEGPVQVIAVRDFMLGYFPDHTWMVMGDFNRTPEELLADLPSTSRTDRFIRTVSSGQITRGRRELDYGVVGGPAAYETYARTLVATVLPVPTRDQRPASDHHPVIFQ